MNACRIPGSLFSRKHIVAGKGFLLHHCQKELAAVAYQKLIPIVMSKSKGYPNLQNLMPRTSRSRSASPYEMMDTPGEPRTQSRTISSGTQSVRSDHWGVIGYYQPVQTLDAITSADPYIVLNLPEDVLPKVAPQKTLNLPFLQW